MGTKLDNVVELEAKSIGAGGTIDRLVWHRDKITSITAIATFDDGSVDVLYHQKKLSEHTFELACHQRAVMDLMERYGGEPEADDDPDHDPAG